MHLRPEVARPLGVALGALGALLVALSILIPNSHRGYTESDFRNDLVSSGWSVGADAYSTAVTFCHNGEVGREQARALASLAQLTNPEGNVQAYVDAVMKTC